MDANLHMRKQKDEALCATRSDGSLVSMLAETLRRLEAVRCSKNRHSESRCKAEEPGRSRGEELLRRNEGGMGSPAEEGQEDDNRGRSVDEEQVEKVCKRKVLGALRELSVLHMDRVTAWRAALREYTCTPSQSPAEGSDHQHPHGSKPECEVPPCSNSFSITFQSIGEDVELIMDKLSKILMLLDAEILHLSAEEASTVEAVLQETRKPDTSKRPEDGNNPLSSHDRLESDLEAEDGGGQRPTGTSPDNEQTSDSTLSSSDDVKETSEGLEAKCQVEDNEASVSLENQADLQEETEKESEMENDKGKEEEKCEWITVGLTGKVEDGQSLVPDACFVRAPAAVAAVLRCEAADAFSCLMVSDSEELVSRVIRVRVLDGANLHFPVTVAVPFWTRYRSSYRDVAVKIVDGERRTSYVTPVTAEGACGGPRVKGSLAEVRVYSLGLFAVVSCLKRENYTVPRRGLSIKLPMDPRISLSYLPGSFTAPVIAQTMVQPIDAVVLAAVKSRSDVHHSVVSASPLLSLTHPTSQRLRRPLSVTLPCPPNPEKKRDRKGQRGDTEQSHPCSASPPQHQPTSHRLRFLGASLKSPKEMSNESLTVLGSRDRQWSVLDKVNVKNQQNGLVAFELTEIFDRLLVVRLVAPLQPCHLTSLAEELEESVCSHAVTVVLQRRQDEPHTLLVAALPSRDLGWEQNKLRAQGYSGPLETSSEMSMREGDQLLLRFSGNITSTAGIRNHQNTEHITFHTQRKNHLLVHLTEVDPFGNYSSPHYKGTVMFYKVSRGQLAWRSDKPAPVDTSHLGDAVCKLSLTLPKKVRNTNRPVSARVKLCEEADSLLDSLLLWLSGELSEEDIALLVLSLRLRRSTAQRVKVRAGDSPSSQAFHVLALWRRGLPAGPHQPKASQLAQCLAKSGRPDLARELLLRQAAATRPSSLK